MKANISLLCILFYCISSTKAAADPFPVQFSIPAAKVVKEIPQKTRDFAFIVPGQLNTYIYTEEADYYRDYQQSYFAITKMKGGWDCMRHYEILANGCIPYFLDIDNCNPNTMALLPKELIKEAMNLEGVSSGRINHRRFNRARYYEILNKLLEYTRTHLTTQAMAEYILRQVDYSGSGTILYLSQEVSPDYMRECVLIGLKEALGTRIIDVPKIDYLYTSYPSDVKKLYGKGFSYTKILDDIPVDRSNIEERIKNKEFDLIIYGSVHRGLPFHELVCATYQPNQIIYICGEDAHQCPYTHLPRFFLREYDGFKKN